MKAAENPLTASLIELGRETSRARWKTFALIALAALAARALFLIQAREAPLFELLVMDARQYHEWAQRIAGGEWLGDAVFYQAPLYPYFLALIQTLFGDGLWPIRIVQALLGALSCGFLFLAGEKLVSRRSGIACGLLLAFYPPAIFFDALVQKASIGGVLVVFLVWGVASAQRAPSWQRFLGLGLTLGFLALTREESRLVWPVLLAWVLWRFRDRALPSRVRWIAAALGGLALVLLPVAWRNQHVGGEFLVSTSQAGPNFYIGNHQGSLGIYEPLRAGRSNTPFERQDAFELAEAARGRKLSPSEVSDYWFERAFTWIKAEPGAWLALLWQKLRLLVHRFEVPDAEDQYYFAQYSSLLRALGAVFHLGVLLPLAAAGIVLTWRSRRDVGIVLALLGTFAVGVVAFYVFGRYRYPVVPPAIVFAAVALVQGQALVSVGAARKLVPALIAATLAAVLCNWPLPDRPAFDRRAQMATSHANAGAALSTQGQNDAALREYQRALELQPNFFELHANVALVHAREGRNAEAMRSIHTALRGRPDDPRFLYFAGTLAYLNGDTPAAVNYLERSTSLFPRDPEVWQKLREILERTKQRQKARAVTEQAIQHHPAHVPLRIALAWSLATSPEPSLRDATRALQLAEQLDRDVQGQDPGAVDALAAAYALAGRFDEAVAAAERGARVADERGVPQYGAELRARAALYREHKTYQDSP